MFNGAPGEIRTPDPLVRSQMLYPIELRAQLLLGNWISWSSHLGRVRESNGNDDAWNQQRKNIPSTHG